MLRLHLLPFFGPMLVHDIRARDVKEYRTKRIEADADPATVNREWNLLRAILNHAVTNELLAANPVPRGSIKPLKTSGDRKVFFEPEEWRAFLLVFTSDAAFFRWRSTMKNKQPMRGRIPRSPASKREFAWLQEMLPFIRGLVLHGDANQRAR